MQKANIFNIQKFSIHDGPGIRTVVFFKGCPLKCLWCANPESQKSRPQLSVIKSNCMKCGACMEVCPQNAITMEKDGANIDRDLCDDCGLCASECYSRAIKSMGEEKSTKEVFDVINEDAVFYANSGGGYTLSGGEPLFYADFCLELTNLCTQAGFHGAIETSGYGDTEKFKELCGKLDVIFFDVKHMDPEKHKELTGVSNDLILSNLKEIQSTSKEVIIRTPLIPGINDDMENIEATAKLCLDLEKVSTWELLPYHKLGEHKYMSLGENYELEEVLPPKKDEIAKYVDAANSILSTKGKACVVNKSTIG